MPIAYLFLYSNVVLKLIKQLRKLLFQNLVLWLLLLQPNQQQTFLLQQLPNVDLKLDLKQGYLINSQGAESLCFHVFYLVNHMIGQFCSLHLIQNALLKV